MKMIERNPSNVDRISFWWQCDLIETSNTAPWLPLLRLLRIKKKLEGDISDIEIQLAHATRQFTDAQRANKDISAQIKDAQVVHDDTERVKEEVNEQVNVTERRINLLQAEVDELRSAVEQAEIK